MGDVVSFDAEKATRYLERAMWSFLRDPADSDYQRGYLAALLTVYREGLDKGEDDGRFRLLDDQAREGAQE